MMAEKWGRNGGKGEACIGRRAEGRGAWPVLAVKKLYFDKIIWGVFYTQNPGQLEAAGDFETEAFGGLIVPRIPPGSWQIYAKAFELFCLFFLKSWNRVVSVAGSKLFKHFFFGFRAKRR